MTEVVDIPARIAGVHPELALLLSQLDQTTAEWRSQVEDDVTEVELRWQAFPDGHSIGAELAHIAAVEHFWLHHVAVGEAFEDLEEATLGAPLDQFGVLWPIPPAGKAYADYVALLRTTRERTRRVIAALGDPARVSTRSDGRQFTLRWLLTHVIVHEAYHGGQAALLLLQQRKRKA